MLNDYIVYNTICCLCPFLIQGVGSAPFPCLRGIQWCHCRHRSPVKDHCVGVRPFVLWGDAASHAAICCISGWATGEVAPGNQRKVLWFSWWNIILFYFLEFCFVSISVSYFYLYTKKNNLGILIMWQPCFDEGINLDTIKYVNMAFIHLISTKKDHAGHKPSLQTKLMITFITDQFKIHNISVGVGIIESLLSSIYFHYLIIFYRNLL